MAAPPDNNSNLKGTSRSSFKIGKGGPSVAQVVGEPDRLLLPQKLRWGATSGTLSTQSNGNVQVLSDSDLAARSGGQMLFQSSGGTPYVQTSSTTTFQVLGYFIFAGTGSYNPSFAKVIAAANNNSGNDMEIQVFDETNSQVIVLFQYPSQTNPQILTQALSNLPVGEAIFSIAGRRNGGGSARVRLYNLTIR